VGVSIKLLPITNISQRGKTMGTRQRSDTKNLLSAKRKFEGKGRKKREMCAYGEEQKTRKFWGQGNIGEEDSSGECRLNPLITQKTPKKSSSGEEVHF